MNYCLHITSAPFNEQGSSTALLFARALMERGHTITRIFFSGNGVQNGNALCVAPQDEINLPEAWQAIAESHKCEMILCVSSALKAGIINDTEAKRYDKSCGNILPAFELSGLGQLVEACLTNDRIVRF
jgi:tRNA 2-thiouridine synthesizing protein D